MQCFYPISLKIDGKHQLVPCRKCAACLSNRRSSWSFRMVQELKVNACAYFLTLTYDDDHIPMANGYPTLKKKDLQLFVKRLRKLLDYKQVKLRYYAVGEYGKTTARPHYHLIVYLSDYVDIYTCVNRTWLLGHNYIGTCTERSIGYVAKYCIKPPMLIEGVQQKEFSLMSRKPPIGHNYIAVHKSWHLKDMTRRYVVTEGGYRLPLPELYKRKIYTSKILNNLHNINYDKKRLDEEVQNELTYCRKYPHGNYYKDQAEQRDATNLQIFKNMQKNDKL